MNCGTFSLWLRLFLFNYLAADARKKKACFGHSVLITKKKRMALHFCFWIFLKKVVRLLNNRESSLVAAYV